MFLSLRRTLFLETNRLSGREPVEFERLDELGHWLGAQVDVFSTNQNTIHCLEAYLSKKIGGSSLRHSAGENLVSQNWDFVIVYGDLFSCNQVPDDPHSAVLCLPASGDRSWIPQSLVVALNPENQTTHSLAFSLDWSAKTGISIDLFHVGSEAVRCSCEHLILENYGDQLHWEYPRIVEQLVAGAVPLLSVQQRKQVKNFLHRRGDLFIQIESLMANRPGAWLVLDWKGSFAPGRSLFIRKIVAHAKFPVLLVRGY
jgi:hypothetical protein